MFVYIDEAGHTGKNSADQAQPIFLYMALASMKNIDLDIGGNIGRIMEENQITELHGVEIASKIELIAVDIMRLLQAYSARFFVAVIEKNYLVYAKMYDTLFDNVENHGARYLSYQIRPLRLMLLSNLCYITPKEVAHYFYRDCLFANTEADSIAALIKTCDAILSNIDKLRDDRSKEIIGDAVRWAKEHPTSITAFNTRKIDRWRHLPHVAGFLPMLSMISKYSKSKKSKIYKIVHDEQQQVKKVITEIHAIAADPKRLAIWDLRDNGYYDLVNIKETVFDIKDSKASLGLQIVDICLYVISHTEHIEANGKLLPNTKRLLDCISEHIEPFIFTIRGFQAEVKTIHDNIMTKEYSFAELENGKRLIAEMERKHKEQEI